MKKISLILMFLSLPAASQGDRSVEITDNIASEYASCSSYFSIMQATLLNSNKKEGAARYGRESVKALEYSFLVMQRIKPEDLSEDITLSRYKVYLDGMMAEINNDVSNISILMSKHLRKCQKAMSKPEEFMTSFFDH